MTASRVGVLGGTFDPIHHGHLAAASEVCAVMGLDQVLLVPAHRHPFKPEGESAPGEHRLAMVEAVAANDDRLEASDVDLARGGVTYTVDTLTDLREQLPGAELVFIAGADALARMGEWRDARRLGELAEIVGVTRPGHSLPRLETPFLVVEVPPLAVSSTDVRRRVKTGSPIRYLVPDVVAAYIERHGLYLGGAND